MALYNYDLKECAKNMNQNDTDLDLPPYDLQQGWYCPRCDTNHPINMVCLPEQMIWDVRINDWVPIGQKLIYHQ